MIQNYDNSNLQISTIKPYYIADDCCQLMIGFSESLTIMDGEKTIFGFANGSCWKSIYINDERRFQFPYHSFPFHITERDGEKGILANQLLEYNKIYTVIKDGLPLYYMAIKKNDKVLILKNTSITDAFSMNFDDLKVFARKKEKNPRIKKKFNSIYDKKKIKKEEEKVKQLKKKYKN